MAEEKHKGFKRRENTYRIIIAVLVLIILFMGWQLMQTKTRVETVIVEKENVEKKLESELDSLMEKHEKIKKKYSEVSGELSEKDSIIKAKAEEIERLIASQADYNRIKRKLEYLRNSHQRYVQQIDSLFTVNQRLKEKNKQITEKYEKTEKEKEEVTEKKEQLEEKVEVGALLKAYNITAKGIHMGGWTGDKEKITTKTRRLDKIKICFTIGENLIAESGKRTIYIRIARPDDKILYKREDDYFMYNEEKLQYSMKKTINYQNKKLFQCLYWKKDKHVDEVMEGKYHIGIFTDGHEIGQAKMILE